MPAVIGHLRRKLDGDMEVEVECWRSSNDAALEYRPASRLGGAVGAIAPQRLLEITATDSAELEAGWPAEAVA
jgi:hypothetical protein